MDFPRQLLVFIRNFFLSFLFQTNLAPWYQNIMKSSTRKQSYASKVSKVEGSKKKVSISGAAEMDKEKEELSVEELMQQGPDLETSITVDECLRAPAVPQPGGVPVGVPGGVQGEYPPFTRFQPALPGNGR